MVCEKIFQSIFGHKVQNLELGTLFSCFLIVEARKMDFLFQTKFRVSGRFQEWVNPFLGLKSIGCPFYSLQGERRKKMEKERIYYQECAGRLLNVYRYTAGDDEFKLDLGEIIDDPAHHCIEGDPKTTIRRVQ